MECLLKLSYLPSVSGISQSLAQCTSKLLEASGGISAGCCMNSKGLNHANVSAECAGVFQGKIEASHEQVLIIPAHVFWCHCDSREIH